jgi:hypothetical protein
MPALLADQALALLLEERPGRPSGRPAVQRSLMFGNFRRGN